MKHPWSGRPLNETEIAAEKQALETATEALATTRYSRWYIRFLNRQYIKALKNGSTIDDANHLAAAKMGRVEGALLASAAWLLTIGSLSYIIGLFQTMRIFWAILVTFGYLCILAWSLARTRVIKGFKWLFGKLKRKKASP